MKFPIPPEAISADATVALLTLIERYGDARLAAHPNNASSDADWHTKQIAARDLLEQIRQQLDPGNLLAVCPACAQVVQRKGDDIERHRHPRKKGLCHPSRTLEVLLEDAKRRAEIAARATAGIFGRG